MANSMYDYGRELYLAGSTSWALGTVRMCFVSTAVYTFSAGHTALAQTAAGLVGTASSAFAGKTVSTGVADSNDITIQAVPTTGGSVVGAIILYHDNYPAAVGGGTPLIAYIDTAASGLPITPNGGDITVSWSNGSNKIFKL